MRSLTIISCSKVFDYSSLSQCRQLDSLSIGHSPHLSDEELIPLAAHKRLHSLTLNKCFNITNSSILTMIRDCILNNVSFLSLIIFAIDCYEEKKEKNLFRRLLLFKIASLIKNLFQCYEIQITLISCDGITDEVLYSLASIQYPIETISVQGCACITRFIVNFIGSKKIQLLSTMNEDSYYINKSCVT